MKNRPYAIGYVRVSTDQQADSGLGLEAQRASIVATAQRLGLELRDVLTDAGVSGSVAVAARPILQQAVQALQRDAVLLVAKRDRLGRDAVEVGLCERDLNDQGVRVVSAAGEGTDNDDPASVLLRRLIDAVAEYERGIGIQRTKAALEEKRKKGEQVGTLPFGVQLAADGKHVEPAPVEQRILGRLRALRAAGYNLQQIARDLNAHGWTTRRGTAWRFQYVARLAKAGLADARALRVNAR